MKKLLSYLLAFFAFLLLFYEIILICFDKTTSSNFFQQVSYVVVSKEDDDFLLKKIYQEVKQYSLTQENVQDVLASKEASQFFADLEKNILNHSANHQTIESLVHSFLYQVSTKYSLSLSNSSLIDLETQLTTKIENVISTFENNQETKMIKTIFNFVHPVSYAMVKRLIWCLFFFTLVGIIAMNWKEKCFCQYFAWISFMSSISIFLSCLLIRSVVKVFTSSQWNTTQAILQVLFTDLYKIGAVLLVLFVVFMFFHFYLVKRVKDYEKIPF